jgi:hypothetical protein
MKERILAILKGHASLREILKGLTSKLNQDKEKDLTEKFSQALQSKSELCLPTGASA